MEAWLSVIAEKQIVENETVSIEQARNNKDKLNSFLYSTLFQVENRIGTMTPLLKHYINHSTLLKGRIIILPEFFVIKYPKNNDDREIYQQTAIGLVVNSLIKEYPNFVQTYGLFNLPQPSHPKFTPGDRRKYLPCCVVEKIDGISLSRFQEGKSFKTLYPIFLQLWFAMRIAYQRFGLTHYDLHQGNVIITRCSQKQKIEYPWGIVETNYLAKIFDWGRSYCYVEKDGNRISLGTQMKSIGVENMSNYFYDVFLSLEHSFTRGRDDVEMSKFLDFFNINFGQRTLQNIVQVAKQTYQWRKWLSLVASCPYAHHCFTPNIKSELNPTDPSYSDFLQINHNLSNVVVRINLENRHADLIKQAKSFLTVDCPFSRVLAVISLEELPQSQEEKILVNFYRIAQLSKSIYLIPYYEQLLEHYRSRLDTLMRKRSQM